MKTKVYVLIDPRNNKIRYVGITTKSLKKRLEGHLKDIKNRPDLNYHKINWLKNLQKDKLIPIIEEIVELDTIEEAKEFEIEYIAKYKILFDLTNATIGGDHLGFKAHSRESVLKRRQIQPVCQYNIYGELIAEYQMTEDAARDNNLTSASKITMCCKHNRPHAHGYIWRYKNDLLGDLSFIEHNSLNFKVLVQYDLEWNEITRYNSYLKASLAIGDNSKGGNIAAVINGKQKTCKGFNWKMLDNFKRASLNPSNSVDDLMTETIPSQAVKEGVTTSAMHVESSDSKRGTPEMDEDIV